MPGLSAIRYSRELGELRLLDQRLLPAKEDWILCSSPEEVAAPHVLL